MDKLLSRALQAKAQAARRLKKINETNKRHRLNQSRNEHAAFHKTLNAERRTSRFEEKEDHRLGPLAPHRAVGKEEVEHLGAFDQHRITPPPVPWEYRIKHWNIVEKDRVVILKGPDRHRIGTVKKLDKASNSLIVEGMNMVPMKVPNVFKSLDANQPSVLFRESPIHYDDVRLVIPVLNRETNKLQDTVVAKVAMSKVYFDKTEGVAEWSRYIAGTTDEIPWPEKEPEKEHFDQPGDSRIMHVETSTYVPKLLEPPFPVSVMDELRNKYSKFRIRHEPEYIAEIEREERRRLAKAGKRIPTPVQELNKSIRAEKKARGPPVMTESIMEQIGRVMAQNKPELLEKVQHQDVGVD